MAHEYSVVIHQYISRRIALAEQNKEKAARICDHEMGRFYEGQINELVFFREYLNQTINHENQKYF